MKINNKHVASVKELIVALHNVRLLFYLSQMVTHYYNKNCSKNKKVFY